MPEAVLEANKILDDVRRMKLEILELEKGHIHDMQIIRSAVTSRRGRNPPQTSSALENDSTVSRWLRDVAQAHAHGRTVSDSTILSTATALSLTADATDSTAPSSPIAPSVCPHPASGEDTTDVASRQRDEDHAHDRAAVSSSFNTPPQSPSPSSSALDPVCTTEERDDGARGDDLVCRAASDASPPSSALGEVGAYMPEFGLYESRLTPSPYIASLPPPRRGFRALVSRVVRSVRWWRT
ncbi:hypothetical protein EXIGLDRAFT_737463 [Exidia glandulosa HHB12029]|uniref:Uncharacterized protein n=1 Tax=Exidia glandulosa HHB12029 TaxID=1314781 RepID=A0A166MXS8_EXIGL|nr:hypothetical protein EXIGLDRAFT_737463 [Exidia glandulosa HHB12029]